MSFLFGVCTGKYVDWGSNINLSQKTLSGKFVDWGSNINLS